VNQDLLKIQRLAQSGDVALAKRKLLSNIKVGRYPLESRKLLMTLFVTTGEPSAAIPIGKDFLERVANQEVIKLLINAYLKSDLASEASDFFFYLTSKYPSLEEALNGFLMFSAMAGKPLRVLELPESLRLGPHWGSTTLINLGNAHVGAKRYSDALVCFERALATHTTEIDFLRAQHGIAVSLYETGRYEEVCDRFGMLNEQLNYEIAHILALSLRRLGRVQEGFLLLAGCEHRFTGQPKLLEDLAYFYELMGNYEEAKKLYTDLCSRQLLSPSGRRNMGHVCLKTRDFRAAHQFLRTKAEAISSTVTVDCTQGLGDVLLFSRFLAPWALARGLTRVSLVCDERLIPFLQSGSNRGLDWILLPRPRGDGSFGHLTLFDVVLDQLKEFDQAARQSTFNGHPIIRLSPPGAGEADSKLSGQESNFRVGISWSSANQDSGQSKSLPLEWMVEIVSIALAEQPFEFLNLQYDSDANSVSAESVTTKLFCPPIDKKNDLVGLLSWIRKCDLIVSCSNSLVHLAALVGVPTVVLLPKGDGCLWYWFTEGENSPWYPSVRLARQQTVGNWASCKEEAVVTIRDLIRSASTRH
jgi:tetratricopeptide (TPR) repeat protein